MMESLKRLAELVYAPQRAVNRAFGRRDVIKAALMALIVSVAYMSKASGLYFDLLYLLSPSGHWDRSSTGNLVAALLATILGQLGTMIILAGICIPVMVLIANSLGGKQPLGSVMGEHYWGLLAVTFYNWAVTHLWVLLPAMLLFDETGRNYEAALMLSPLLPFGLLMVMTVGQRFRLSWVRSVLVLSLVIMSLVLVPFVGGLLLVVATSPLLLLILFLLVRRPVAEWLGARRARQRLMQSLQAATSNPADASAHYQLGFVYEQRGELDLAVQSYQRAIEIDPDEVDAHYRLGRIARRQGRLAEAITHFDATVRRSPDHAQHEVWREVGATYLTAGQYEDARMAFERFLDQRSHDAEGLYYLGLVYDRLGQGEKAIETMQTVIQVVETAPAYKSRLERQWLGEAREFLKEIGQRA
jgi:tetratricopeptide (TPR) repeat protein